jgi:glycine oxidase
VTRALLEACRRRGVEVRENARVTAIAPDGLSVETAAGRIDTDGVLIAAGAWSSDLYPGLPPTRPVRGHLVSYDIVPGAIPSIVRHGGTYILQRSSGLTIAGSSIEEVGFDRSIDRKTIADITKRAGDLAPELRGIEPAERWNGFRPAVAGDRPVIGQIPGTAIYTAFGHYRNGILLAPETARLIAGLV